MAIASVDQDLEQEANLEDLKAEERERDEKEMR